jgi:hypothetical protein
MLTFVSIAGAPIPETTSPDTGDESSSEEALGASQGFGVVGAW